MIAYDKNDQQLQSFQNKKGIHCTDDLAALIASCDYIFGVYALDPSAQKFIIKEWLKYQYESSFHFDDLNIFLNEEWLAHYSNGLLAYRNHLSFISMSDFFVTVRKN